ncbi:MAG: isoprenylcysteine carboxylmethyltransferase family protein [Desulfobulbaceae bacterium]|nr:isoprenylcysteine carboxylmethyltransferase family protein [Desulfobulbaceae bacterium]
MPIFHPEILKYEVQDALKYWIFIPASVIGSGKFIDYVFSLPTIPHVALLQIAACILLVAGMVVIRRAMHDLSLYGKGTPNPHRPPKILVRQGVYGMCRHPMFLGYDLAALGVVLLCNSPAMLIVSYPVFVFVQIRFLQKEEQYLARRFRKDFIEYKDLVPFLVPFSLFRRKHQ